MDNYDTNNDVDHKNNNKIIIIIVIIVIIIIIIINNNIHSCNHCNIMKI
jgi:hypothetical protein